MIAISTRTASDHPLETVPPRARVCGPSSECSESVSWQAEERRRAVNYPLSRWYLRPLAVATANTMADSWLRPAHASLAGAACAAAAAGAVLNAGGNASPLAAVLVLAYWFFDRLDGPLARRQRRVSAAGAWIDANLDEGADIGLHLALAAALDRGGAAGWLWAAWFVGAKYLFMYGLHTEQSWSSTSALATEATGTRHGARWIHWPANADVRTHLLALALATGWFRAELAALGAYYALRMVARWTWVPRRLVGATR